MWDKTPLPLVDGRWVKDASFFTGALAPDIDPSTARPIAEIRVPNPALAEHAMDAAHAAWRAWRSTSVSDRRNKLAALANALERRRETIVPIICAEAGILRARAEEEISHGIELLLEIASQSAPRSRRISQARLPEAILISAPYGVVVWILSWNSPIAALCKCAAPLMAGNTVVLKASHHTPLCAHSFAEAVAEAAFPAGVVNVMWDERGELAAGLVQNRLLGKCAFTGSLNTAREVLKHIAGERVRPTFMETGGGGAQVVFDDVDLDEVLPHIFWGAFTLGGQICCAGTRILVEESIFERVAGELAGMAASLRVGSAHLSETQLGPVISRQQLERLESLVARAQNRGATLLVDGGARPENGFFVAPQVAITETIANPLYDEEIFGPVVAVAPFRTRAEAIERIDAIAPGLALAVYTRDTTWVDRHARDLACGTIWINGYYQSSVRVPFGGMRDSGYGRERGEAGLREFLQEQVIVSH